MLTDESQLLFAAGVLIAFVLAIALLVIIFISRIKFLKNRLFDTLEVSADKDKKITELQQKLEEVESKEERLGQELQRFDDTKVLLKSKKALIVKIEEKMSLLEKQERQHLNTVETYSKEFQTLSYRYKSLKRRNEFLVDENKQLRAENTKILMRVREQERRIFERLKSLQGNSRERRIEIEKQAEGIFEKNQQLFESVRDDALLESVASFSDEIFQYHETIISSFKESLERERDMQSDIVSQAESRQKAEERVETLLERLKDKERLGDSGSEVMKYIVHLSDIDSKSWLHLKMEKSHEDAEQILSAEIALPNGHKLEIDTTFSLESYEIYRQTGDHTQKEQALALFLKSFREHVESLSQKKTNRQHSWMLVASNEAMQTACKHKEKLCDFSSQKGIILVSPSALLAAIERIVTLWKYQEHYDLAMQLISKAEAIEEAFVDDAKTIGNVSQRLEMIQESLSTKTNT
ncbi:MAG TPA: DNA recombination protein RmuC [Epsilonproteobacteria bacterium]|nr:DNA recombination protein RmuC [Campylobacterota bacterium]